MDQPTTQHSILARLHSARLQLSRRSGLLVVLLVALLTHLPGAFSRLASDDFMIRANVAGDPVLAARGFMLADTSQSFWNQVSNAFHFYNPAAGTTDLYQDYGNLPWWSSEDAKMNPWRPLSATTHWLDARIAPDSFALQALHSLLYVLLMATMAYRLFLRIGSQISVAVLGALFLVVDAGHVMSFSWIAARNVFIAVALGCYALEQFWLWREESRHWAFVRSALAFLAALLSAENSLSILAYMGAYLLFIERGGLLRKVVLLAPYLLIVLVWRLVYNWLGFGADDIGLYLDPGNDPVAFLGSIFKVLPLVLSSLITGVDGVASGVAPDLRIWVSVAGAVLLLICLPLIRRLLRDSPLARAMLLGSVLAAVPACTLVSAGTRAGAFAAIGFFWLLARWVHLLLDDPRWRADKFVVGAVLCFHLFLPGLGAFLITSTLLPVTYTDDGQFSSVQRAYPAGRTGPSLVVVNSPTINNDYYLPFDWRFNHGAIPETMNVLAPGLVSLDLKRLSARVFELSAPAGLPLHNRHTVSSLDGHRPLLSSAYGAQMLQGLVASPAQPLNVGDRRYSGDMRVTVLALTENRPSRLQIEFFDDDMPDSMVWQYYDWRKRQYVAMPVPAVGEILRFPGPFDLVR